jgi:cytochrome b
MASVKVWDPAIRVFHWGLVSSFAVAWISADEIRDLHEWAGYAAAGLVGIRLVLGTSGSHYARFGQFVRSPRHILRYAKALAKRRERRYLGHNPLGGVMVVILITLIVMTALTGFLQTTDAFWGVEWVEDVHEGLANTLLASVLLHLMGVVHASLRHRENLVRAMMTGRKREADTGDIA